MIKNIPIRKTLCRAIFVMAGFFVLLSTTSSATASNGFVQTVGGIGTDYAYSITQSSDGGYLVLGDTLGLAVAGRDIYVSKFTSTGDLDTSFGVNGTRTIGHSGNESAYAMTETADGGYIIVGHTDSFGAGSYDVYIIKLTSTGDLDTSFGVNGTRTIGGTESDRARSVAQTTDDGFIITGYTLSNSSAGIQDFYIIKLTNTGDLDTSFGSGGTRVIGGAASDLSYSTIQTADGGYAFAGYTESYGEGNQDVYIIKLTSTGDLDTSFGVNGTRTIGGVNSERAYNLIQTADGGYMMIGQTDSFGAGSLDVYIIKLTNTGDLDTSFGVNGTRTIGGTGTDYGYSVVQMVDGSYVITGFTDSFGAGGYDVYIIKLTNTGDLDTSFGVNGTRTIGGTGNDFSFSIIKASDSGYAIAGYTDSFGAGGADPYIIKIGQDGDLDQCSHDSGNGGMLSSGGALGTSSPSISYDGMMGTSTPTLSSGGTLTQQCTIQTITDTTIQNPDTTKIDNAVAEGYISLDNGTITNTDSVTTQVNVTFTQNGKEIIFPTNTTITEQSAGSFNFQNFTLTTQDVQSQQPTSRKAFRLGIEGEKLNFSQNITVTAYVGEAFNNQTLDILYQEEGESTWQTQGTCTVTNGNCTFQTNHATIYTINGNLQATGSAPMNINTEVKDTLTLDCYDTTNGSGNYDVLLGTTTNPGTVTAGVPAIGTSTCDTTTNDDQGYYLTIEDDNGGATATLTHNDPNTAAVYEIQDLTQWNEGTLTTENWNAPTTKGLGFSVITFPDTTPTNNTFDGVWNNTSQCPEGTNPDTNDYAGIPDTPQAIAAVPEYSATQTTTNICYKVDVPASQPSGIYTGSVTYTATSDASSYLN